MSKNATHEHRTVVASLVYFRLGRECSAAWALAARLTLSPSFLSFPLLLAVLARWERLGK